MLCQAARDVLKHCVISEHHLLYNNIYFGQLYVLGTHLVVLRLAWNDIYWHSSPGNPFDLACKACIDSLHIDISDAQILVDCVVHETMSAKFVRNAGIAVKQCFPQSSNITVAYNNCAFELKPCNDDIANVKFVGINFFAVFMTYHYGALDFLWKPTEKILLLLGRPYKYNRLPVIYEFWKQNLLDDLMYSFSPIPFINQEQIESETWQQAGIDILKNNTNDDFSNFDFAQWAHSIARSLDRDLDLNQKQNINNFNGTDVDVELYEQTCIEVIPETHYDQPWFATEKTYRALALGFPFVHVGYHFSECLHSLGFRTFESYTNQDFAYDNNDSAHHVDLIPKTARGSKDFLQVAQHKHQQIQQDIQHNRSLVTKIAQQDVYKIQSLYPHHRFVAELFFLLDQ